MSVKPMTTREMLTADLETAHNSIKPFLEVQLEVNDLILKERQRQNQKWGRQRHDYGKWLAIIGEEYGESCQALGPLMGLGTGKETDKGDPLVELIQLAASAAAAAEQLLEERRQYGRYEVNL